MTEERPTFADTDQTYLRDVQYRDGSHLARRANLHAKYRTSPTPWFDWIGAQIDLFEGAQVLEAGCGTGWLWSESSFPIPSGVALTLTDLSPGMVDEATHRVAASHRVHSATGQSADLQTLPFDADSFDRVVANHMLFHLPDPAMGVAEMARVVRSDGSVVAATNGRENLRELWELRSRVFGTSQIDETADIFNPEIGFELFRERFVDIRWREYPDQLRCTNPADVLAHICSTPSAENATTDELASLAEAVAEAFDDGGGQLLVTKDVSSFVCRGVR